MSDSFGVKIQNFGEIQKALRGLGPDQSRAVSMSAREAMKKVLMPELMRRAPSRTGELEDSFKIQSKTSKTRGTVEVKVGADPKIKAMHRAERRDGTTYMRPIVPSRYLHLVEKGHRKGRGRSSAKANPFMHRSMMAKRQAMEKVFIETINRSIEKVWRSVRKRQAKKGA